MLYTRIVICFFLFAFSFIHGEEIHLHETIMIPMRDGKELPTDIYIAKDNSKPNPCVLIRSPGGRQAKSATVYLYLTQMGYNLAIQDTRSSLDVEGKTLPYWSDGWGEHKDGYDTVNWLAKSKFSNGNIGTVGVSALGITQLLMAPTAPEGLKCQYIGMAAANLYHDAIFPGGQLLKNQVEGWLGLYAKSPEVKKYVCEQPHYNEFWNKFNTHEFANQVKAPAVHYGGWYDIFVQGTIDAFVARQENGAEGAKGKQKLLLGPWSHFWPMMNKLGDFEVPAEGKAAPLDISVHRWFDHYLKNASNGADAIPAVTYYVMGPFDGSSSSGNVWKHTDRWPVPSVNTAFYLTSDNHLKEEKRETPESTFAFEYDSSNPIPTLGGRNLFLESGPKDQRSIETRKDIVLFTSAPLQEELEVTGRVRAQLYFFSDQKEADVAVRLCDVYPDGKSILIADGLAHKNKEQTSSAEPMAIDVDLWSTSIVFAKGHRIRVSVSGSNYPRFEKTMNLVDGKPVIAKHQLYTDGQYASQITLPIVRRGTETKI